jgi:hypothetical protein
VAEQVGREERVRLDLGRQVRAGLLPDPPIPGEPATEANSLSKSAAVGGDDGRSAAGLSWRSCDTVPPKLCACWLIRVWHPITCGVAPAGCFDPWSRDRCTGGVRDRRGWSPLVHGGYTEPGRTRPPRPASVPATLIPDPLGGPSTRSRCAVVTHQSRSAKPQSCSDRPWTRCRVQATVWQPIDNGTMCG